jgi:hypothetical protein
MLPPPKKSKLPPPRKSEAMQLNRLFDCELEMRSHIDNAYPGARIVRFWKVEQLACEITWQKPKKI